MKQKKQEEVARHECPAHVAEMLREAGGENRFGEPNFRIVWGWNRLVAMTGEWQQWEKFKATLRDKVTGYSESREFIQLASAIIETRTVPKYLPANAWHLEMWRPPDDYGTPEQWGKAGGEVVGVQTLDTSGAYPYQGEYELCYCLTSDLTSHGTPIPLETCVVNEIVLMIRHGLEKFTFLQRKAAIEQRMAREEEGYVRLTEDVLRDGLKPFAGEKFVTVPDMVKP